MKYPWSKTVFPIAAIFSFRMLGLFLLIPVFTLYAAELEGATPMLIGIALGGYGLTQGLLQIPFGMMSDKLGRKPILTLGLLLFAFGSLIGALSDSIYGIILARALQGSGAIGSVLIALLADLTPDEQRTRAMAVIGMTIGTSFSLAMVISPALSARYGLAGIFYLTAGLALAGILLLNLIIPTPAKEQFHPESEASPLLFKSVLTNFHLLRLNLGIFCQHFILTSTFFVIPIILRHQFAGELANQQWRFYLPLMVLAFLVMVPFIIFAEKKKKMRPVFLFAVLITAIAQTLLAFNDINNWFGLFFCMWLYFVAFNILEASLPSLVSKQANPNNKGTAMGVYSTCQFLGIFAGGLAAGLAYQLIGSQGIFITNAIIGSIWFGVACFMQPNAYRTTVTFHYSSSSKDEQLISQLLALPGVIEVVINKEEQVIYLRINQEHYQADQAKKLINSMR